MNPRRITSGLAALALAGAAMATTTGPAQAGTHHQHHPLGTRSLAQVLAADGHHFDHNWGDFDILDKLVSRVLAAKPSSRLSVLTQGGHRVTAFLPTDGAFRRAAEDIVGGHFSSERAVYRALWKVGGLDGAENVLLYHVVPGTTLTYHRLRAMAPTKLHTLQGGSVKVRVRDGRVVLVDRDKASPNAKVVLGAKDINKGNRQIAHGITAMLSPVVG